MSTGTPTPPRLRLQCYHCGLPCPDASVTADDRVFCCTGCRTVYEVLRESGLDRYYRLEDRPGTPQREPDARPGRFAYLDDEDLRARLLDFDDGHTARTTLRLPQIHCASCVWLLENLDRLEPAVRRSEVDFLRRELSVTWDQKQLSLRGLVERLDAIGYGPEITLSSEAPARRLTDDPLIRRLGLAGFCFGNAMLFSLPEYFANPGDLTDTWRQLFGLLNLLLGLPVLLYSATEFLGGAWRSLAQRTVTIDVPIALGIVTLFGRSLYEILASAGPGYMDSFTGLVFFLLVGRLFQRSRFTALSFERDYRSYFPLAVTVRTDDGETSCPVSALRPGQHLVARHGELVPADSRLLSVHGRIDFSYVTGESDPVEAERGDLVWAGGRVAGSVVELEVLREVSQSYLTRLWNQDVFGRQDADTDTDLSLLANRMARWFTGGVLAVAAATAVGWLLVDPALAAHAATSVLIVACPCALALSTPFTTGTALNILACRGLFLREGPVVERLGRVGAVVFDKTGTLTSTGQNEIVFEGSPLAAADAGRLATLLRNSVHPLSRKIHAHLDGHPEAAPAPLEVTAYVEAPGLGLAARVDGPGDGEAHGGTGLVVVGSREWLAHHGVDERQLPGALPGTTVHVAIDGTYRGRYRLGNAYRSGLAAMLAALRQRLDLYLLSGDNDRERERLLPLFGAGAQLHFSQSPQDKLRFIRDLEAERRVLMVGDGLNDAGALRQASVGLAVSEEVAAFSPACDGILQADQLDHLPAVLRFARACLGIVAASFALSLLYNVVGLSFAMRGELSPLVSAVLMPISSVSVIAFTTVATRWAARFTGAA